MAYAKLARGAKPGGVNTTASANQNTPAGHCFIA